MTDEQRIDKAAYLLKAIAHPLRMQILLLLTKDEELSVSALQKELSIEQSLLSHHLINMKDKGVLAARRQGKNIFYYLADSAFVNALDVLLANSVVPVQIEM